MTQLAGKIEDLGLGEILQIISFSRKSGVLELEGTGRHGSIIFKDGNVVKATATDLRDDVADMLAQEGVINADQLARARDLQKDKGFSMTLGAVLIEEFKVPKESVRKVATAQIEQIVYFLFQWQTGKFVFELAEYKETPEMIKADPLQYTLDEGLNPQFLAMEGTRRLDEAKRDGKTPTLETAHIGTGLDEAPPAVEETHEQAAEPAQREQADLEGEVGFDDLFRELEEGGGFLDDVELEDAPPDEDKGFRILKYMLTELSSASSVNEIILLILRFSSEIVSRAVVFGMKQESIVGIGQSGVEIDGDVPDINIRAMDIPAKEPSILTEAINKKGLVAKQGLEPIAWNEYLIRELGGDQPRQVFAAPILVQGRVALLLYGDDASGNHKFDDISILEIFIAQTSIAMERILLSKKVGGK